MRSNPVVAIIGIALCLIAAVPAHAQRADPFRDWTSVIVAADWRDGRGVPIEAFDNARRDLAEAFARAGFDPERMVTHTLRPDRPEGVTAEAAMQAAQTMAQGGAGCLVYFTSHGSPGQIVFGPTGRIEHDGMRSIITRWCGAKPTVVVISACYSGGFIPALSAPNRIVLTAARRDRSSFGCSVEATYPYFDECVLQSLPEASDFIALANLARGCVSQREKAEGLVPPSEPQTFIGAEMQLLAPTLRFRSPAP